MKIKSAFNLRATFSPFTASDRLIATFGQARLVRQPNGRHALLGGTAVEHAQAREWCSWFAPEVVFASLPSCVGIYVLAE